MVYAIPPLVVKSFNKNCFVWNFQKNDLDVCSEGIEDQDQDEGSTLSSSDDSAPKKKRKISSVSCTRDMFVNIRPLTYPKIQIQFKLRRSL